MTTWEAWFSLATTAVFLGSLAHGRIPKEACALGCVLMLLFAQSFSESLLLPTSEDAAAAFGNRAVIALAFLYAAVSGLEYTGGTELLTGWLLRRVKSVRTAQVRLLVPVATLSAFLNNTPVVLALIPEASDLAKRLRSSNSLFLLPLSYAAILGGTCTLIGTGTNLLVHNMNEAAFAAGTPTERLGFFAPAIVGLPVALIGVAYMLLFSRRLLPKRQAAVSATDDPRKYTVEVQVESGGPLVGQSIERAGLRRLPGLYIAEIQRGDGKIVAAKPREVLQSEDVLILVGALDSVVDLRKIRGLIPTDDQARKLQVPAWRRTLVEAVVSPRCALLGKTIREGNFRSHYNAAVVAVARGDKRLEGKLGDVKLEVGDVLLLEASPSFLHRRSEMPDFFLVSTVEGATVRRPEKAWHSIAVLGVMVFAASTRTLPILTAALFAALAMVALRCLTMREARRSIDLSVLAVIAAALTIGGALESTGAAKGIASGALSMAGNNSMMALAMVVLATMICTELITNYAAAVIMFPIAMGAAQGLGCSATPFVLGIMIAASASFLTPYGYQTNLMVFSVGGYRVRDYVRFGLPLSVLVFLAAILIVPMAWPLAPAKWPSQPDQAAETSP
ncbi:MAG: SLC13 family permease [Planctomycetota bacterium]